MKRLFATVLVALAALVAPTAAQLPGAQRNVEAGLHSSRAAVAPGERFTIVLRETIREGWHTYWRNPGDSGEASQLTWTTPAGWAVGEIQWPTPEGIPFATLVNYGYEGEVLFPIEVTAPANARPGTDATFSADLYVLVCADICIPEESTVTLSVPVAAQGRDDPQWAPRVAAAVAALPRAEGLTATIARSGRLSVALPNATDFRNPRFFPFSRDVMEAAAAQRPRVGPAGVSFTLAPGVNDDFGTVPLEGLIAFEMADGTRRGIEILAAPGEPIANTDAEAATFSDDYPLLDLEGAPELVAPALSAVALIATLGLAFLGGLILNIMPCVLPVLSVKALAFAGGGHASEARRQGVFYFVGVMVTFMALAGLLIALRAGGEAVGWGFQLQAPWVTSGLALLFFVIGLNLLGVFEFGASLQNAGEGLTRRGGDMGAFFTGALAVIAATPCTAPFMAGAIGAALTQPAGVTLLIFAALALGFALPLTLLHFAPALQRLIPKPGLWMERAKQVLAFPMFAAAIWLAWVLAEQAGAVGVQSLLNIAAAVAFVLFVARWGRVWLIVGLIVLAGTVAVSWRPIVGMQREAALVSEPWSPARVAALRAEGRPVFVNFTAAWCITCKANELSSMQNRRVAQAFAEADVAYLEADWTNRDDEIAAALAEHGRAGVPLYLFYPPGGDVQVLPQVLSEALLIETVSGDAP
ncbi:protein-disulfide reductase DsbD family protein [Terricaulis silvestris]|uniref:Thiol:disulfide interchange protein DsbD n=1 Tax=Terricaulis silvestris TaxID=2686094 RepID=A0A6I6MIF0_9CAUL|nr:protein-disulfide reductase DsbD domain-containing protein [Terricaulis silvestris]QGZ94279.1 Thiol:disulfide interchange protein DsbD precursor [Terricaulis silvestris]